MTLLGVMAPLRLHLHRVGIPHGAISLIRLIKILKIAGGQGSAHLGLPPPLGVRGGHPPIYREGMASNEKTRIFTELKIRQGLFLHRCPHHSGLLPSFLGSSTRSHITMSPCMITYAGSPVPGNPHAKIPALLSRIVVCFIVSVLLYRNAGIKRGKWGEIIRGYSVMRRSAGDLPGFLDTEIFVSSGARLPHSGPWRCRPTQGRERAGWQQVLTPGGMSR